jgi:hypothetical protein
MAGGRSVQRTLTDPGDGLAEASQDPHGQKIIFLAAFRSW